VKFSDIFSFRCALGSGIAFWGKIEARIVIGMKSEAQNRLDNLKC
jgi:hypothetical protein